MAEKSTAPESAQTTNPPPPQPTAAGIFTGGMVVLGAGYIGLKLINKMAETFLYSFFCLGLGFAAHHTWVANKEILNKTPGLYKIGVIGDYVLAQLVQIQQRFSRQETNPPKETPTSKTEKPPQ
jgi:hypothetical protein